jgi:hypothetical protein
VSVDLFEGVEYHVNYFGIRVGHFATVQPDSALAREQADQLAAYLATHGRRSARRSARRLITP